MTKRRHREKGSKVTLSDSSESEDNRDESFQLFRTPDREDQKDYLKSVLEWYILTPRTHTHTYTHTETHTHKGRN